MGLISLAGQGHPTPTPTPTPTTISDPHFLTGVAGSSASLGFGTCPVAKIHFAGGERWMFQVHETLAKCMLESQRTGRQELADPKFLLPKRISLGAPTKTT